MKSYYDILEISQTAEQSEIKRAYYACVKKYSPEHHPVEFEQIKSAYEILRDPQDRKDYDSKLKLDVFKLIRHEEAKAYLSEGKTGKAVKNFEALLKDEPDNLFIMRFLATAYEERGFFNKAIEQYEKLLALNELDMNAWDNYFSCLLNHDFFDKAEHAMRKAVEINSRYALGNCDILISAICFFMRNDDDFVRICFDMLHKLDLSTSRLRNPVIILLNIVIKTRSAAFIDDALLIGKNIRPQDYDYKTIEELQVIKDMISLNDSDEFDDVFPSLFERLINKVETPLERLEQLSMEGYILNEHPSRLRKQIRKIKEAYPRLFALNKDFFLSFLNERNEERLFAANTSESLALIKKHPNLMEMFEDVFEFDEEADDDDYVEEILTPIRAEPKIGRNSPCPCGSGKKYKKCCGI